MSEKQSSKDMEGIFQSMIYDLGLYQTRKDLKPEDIYYVMQGPDWWIMHLYVLNFKRTKVAVGCTPDDPDATSWVYLSNMPKVNDKIIFNAHYGSLRATRASNLIARAEYNLPDFGKLMRENTVNTCYDEPDKDQIGHILRRKK